MGFKIKGYKSQRLHSSILECVIMRQPLIYPEWRPALTMAHINRPTEN